MKCFVQLKECDETIYKCHIQEMTPNKGPCVVFVEDLAEKRTVPYSSLIPWTRSKHFKFDDEAFLTKKCIYKNEKRYLYDKLQDYADVAVIKTGDHYQMAKNKIDFDAYTDLSHFQPYTYDVVAMPFTSYRTFNNSQKMQQNASSRSSNSNGPNNNAVHSPKEKANPSTQQPKIEERNAGDKQQQTESAPKMSNENIEVNPNIQPNHAIQYPVANNYVCYYAPTDGVEQSPYMPQEMLTPQPMYTVAPQVYPVPMTQPYAVSPVQVNQLYSVPFNGWPAPSPTTTVPGKNDFFIFISLKITG